MDYILVSGLLQSCGYPIRVGLRSAGISYVELNHLVTEKNVESLLKEMAGEPNDLEDFNVYSER